MKKMRFAILVSGRGSNMEALIDALADDPGAVIACVISDVHDAPALAKAAERGIEAVFLSPGEQYRTRLTDEAEQAYVSFLKERDIDYVLLAGFMRMLKHRFLRAFENRVLNIHPSLLPAFPGLDTHARVLEAGELETGCTVHFVDEGMDTGAIVAQVRVPVDPEDTPDVLAARVLQCEHRLYAHVVRMLAAGRVTHECLEKKIFSMEEILASNP